MRPVGVLLTRLVFCLPIASQWKYMAQGEGMGREPTGASVVAEDAAAENARVQEFQKIYGCAIHSPAAVCTLPSASRFLMIRVFAFAQRVLPQAQGRHQERRGVGGGGWGGCDGGRHIAAGVRWCEKKRGLLVRRASMFQFHASSGAGFSQWSHRHTRSPLRRHDTSRARRRRGVRSGEEKGS